MPKTHPARRSSRAKASEGPPHDQTMSASRRARKASKSAPLPAHHQDTNTPGPSAVGAEPAWMNQLLDKLDSRIHTAVNEALNARQAAVSSPTVPAAPHLEDVEQAVRASMLASVSDSMTGTGPSCSFIPSSIPLSKQVPLKIKQKIGGCRGRGGGRFVDLRAMLSGSGEEAYAVQIGQTDGAPSLQLVSQKRSAPLTLPAWIKAWNRFCAILSEQDASVTAGLAHHMENVLNLADKKAGWRYYDEQFRHLIGSGMATWGATHLELYI